MPLWDMLFTEETTEVNNQYKIRIETLELRKTIQNICKYHHIFPNPSSKIPRYLCLGLFLMSLHLKSH